MLLITLPNVEVEFGLLYKQEVEDFNKKELSKVCEENIDVFIDNVKSVLYEPNNVHDKSDVWHINVDDDYICLRFKKNNEKNKYISLTILSSNEENEYISDILNFFKFLCKTPFDFIKDKSIKELKEIVNFYFSERVWSDFANCVDENCTLPYNEVLHEWLLTAISKDVSLKELVDDEFINVDDFIS